MARPADQVRKDLKMSVSEVLSRAGIARQTWYRVVNNEGRTPNEETIRRISAALGVEPMEVEEFRTALKSDGKPTYFEIETDPVDKAVIQLAKALDTGVYDAGIVLFRKVADEFAFDGKSEVVEREYRLWRRRKGQIEEEGRWLRRGE